MSKATSPSKEFEDWYYNKYLPNIDPAAAIQLRQSIQFKAKYTRMYQVAKLILEHPEKSPLDIRKEIAITYFVSMRATLDWLHFGEMLIEKYKSETLNTRKAK